jgi:hypothetical protein
MLACRDDDLFSNATAAACESAGMNVVNVLDQRYDYRKT